jgi:3-oxoacyl-[acyl-carrier-protein] synthase II
MSLGSALGNLAETTTFLDRLFTRGAGNPLVFPNLVMNAPLSYASIELGVTGPTAFLTEQEASGEAALAWGGGLIADDKADLCLAGATDELDSVLHAVLREGGLLARREPRPFDPAADGPCPGEGAAILVLEPMARARARGARIYARLVPHPGFAVAATVHGWPRDAADVATGLAPLVGDADLVVASASGRPALDRLEAAALAQARGGRPPLVTAPRAAIGDFGAAGALGAAVAALAIAHGVVPPTRGIVDGADPSVAPVREAQTRPLRAAVVNGLARGGACRPLRLERP